MNRPFAAKSDRVVTLDRKSTKSKRKTATVAPDALVSDSVARQECGKVSRMCIWRWDHDPAMAELGWPPPIQLNNRKYRSRRALEVFKQNLMKRALAARG
jgi:hypothetical protein